MDTVGGYRLIRKLGEGTRAEVWLAHSVRSEDRVVAIKVYRGSTSLEDIDGEIEALVRGDSDHLLVLEDLATAGDGRPCLILPRLSSLSLTRLLVDRASISAGQLVTALAPVVTAVAELHRVGVIHGGIESSTILLDRSGAPILSAFARARVVGPMPEAGLRSLSAAEQTDEPRLLADRRGLVTLVAALAHRVSEKSEVAATGQLIEWIETAVGEDDFLVCLADNLFELAPAAALSFDSAMPIKSQRGAPVAPNSLRSAVFQSSLPNLDQPPVKNSGLKGGPLKNARLTEVITLVTDRVNPTLPTAVLARIRALVAPVRTPVWIVGLAGIAALVVAFTVIPGIGPDDAARTDRASETGALSRSPAPSAKPTQAGPDSVAALTLDDPLAAATVLLAGRASCISRRSISCLAGIDQPGSSAMESDSHLIRLTQTGGGATTRSLDVTVPALVQRLGDSAIIGLGAPTTGQLYPTSVLVVKTSAGWRLRDLTTAASVDG